MPDSLTPLAPVRPAPASSCAHPPTLERVDRRYLASWGTRQMVGSLLLGLPLVVAFSLAAVFHSPLWWAAALVVAGLVAFGVLFFRNPTRRVPAAPGVLVSPADGTIWDIERVDEPEFIGGAAIRVGIFLSVFNVHVNRAPAAGRVAFLKYVPGAFHDARSAAASAHNESNTVGFIREDLGGDPEVPLVIRQISGAIARRIVCPLEDGMPVRRGGLIGMIRYGSRTELFIPESAAAEIRVAVGDRVRGGSSVIAQLPSAGCSSPLAVDAAEGEDHGD